MTGERELLDRLRALAEADERLEAPASVEARVRAAFRQRHERPSHVRVPGQWPAFLLPGLAAAVVVVALLAGLAAREPEAPAEQAAVPAAFGADDDAAPEFVAMLRGDRLADVEALQVLRVQVPRTAVVTLGLPVAMPAEGRTLTAEVLVGEDGVARAVRFVP